MIIFGLIPTLTVLYLTVCLVPLGVLFYNCIMLIKYFILVCIIRIIHFAYGVLWNGYILMECHLTAIANDSIRNYIHEINVGLDEVYITDRYL